ncbi:MAG: S8 family serine peptidase, partial [Sphaerospermopsis kisseleviana]
MSKKSSFVAILATLIVALFVLAVVFIPQPATKSAGIRQADEILSPSAPLDPSLASGLSSPSAPQPSRNLPNLPSVANQPTVPVSIAPTVPSSPGGGPMPGGVNSIVLQPPVSSAGSQGNSSGSAAISAAASAGSSAPAFGFYRTPAEILAGKDLSDPAQRAEAVAEMTEAEEARYAAVLAQAEENGIPVRLERPEGGVAVLYDFRDGEPLYRQTLNANAAISTGANLIRSTAPYNLDGNGFKVGVWDDGSVRNTHQEFRGSRVTNKDTAPFEDHATHVAGTIGATGVQTNAKGMAPLVKIDSYDWDNDIAEMTAAGAAQATDNPSVKIPFSNHSYGAANPKVADMGRYESDCRSTDSLLFGLPYYLVFWA